MATLERLVLAILLAFAACKMSTDNLKPKTDAECAPTGQKACGYKCVAMDDPQTGCGEAQCGACSPPPNSYPACTPALECGYACAPGWGDCDSSPANGCELRVAGGDPNHCGACFRTCPVGCANGVCTPETYGAAGQPRGIVFDPTGQRVYWVDDGNGGELASLTESLLYTPHAYGLDGRPGSPALSRIAVEKATPNIVWATGAHLWTTTNVALYTIDTSLPPTTGPVPYWSEPENPSPSGSERFFGLAVIGNQAYFVRESVPGPCAVTSPGSRCWATGTAVRGLTTWPATTGTATAMALYYGYPNDNGSLCYLVDWTVGEQTLASGIGSWPSRIAVHPGSPGQPYAQWFWADESNGDVWRVPPSIAGQALPPELVDPGNGMQTEMDIQADTIGVVWSDSRAGKVRAWRAYDGAIFDVGRGGQPQGVALSPGYIYWTDSQNRSINRVPR